MATYGAIVRWRRGADEAFTDQRYSRAHSWHFDGGAVVPASSSPHVVRVPFADPAGVDPEEALVVALASCHMLFFLNLAARAGFTVDTYEDQAEGVMGQDGHGREWMSRVVLRPQVIFEGAKRPSADEVETLHHESHHQCYIANSVRTEVVVEGAADGLRTG